MRQSHYLGNGRSYEVDLPLILIGMSTFLMHFQILKVLESNNKPKIANFCKDWLKMAKYETKSLSQER